MKVVLDFEQPLIDLEQQIDRLRDLSVSALGEPFPISPELRSLEHKLSALRQRAFTDLSCAQRVQLSRHPQRPHTEDYLRNLFPDFLEIHGDRSFGDDPAVVIGVASFPAASLEAVAIIGQRKGRTTQSRVETNFGMAKPEGYRKARRLMDLAQRFSLPLLTLIDTPGAYPGIDAEERGQSQAIAECILTGFELDIPSVAVVIGEGGSGGALALGIANRVLMLEYSIYSVISPESCATILWNDASLASQASGKLKLLPEDLKSWALIDEIIIEPEGGAHRDPTQACKNLERSLVRHYAELGLIAPAQRRLARQQKFRQMGLQFLAEEGTVAPQ